MSVDTAKGNPYLDHASQIFVDAIKRLRDMEANFHPSMIKDYEATKKQVISRAVDLVKLGVDSYSDGEAVGIQVGEEIYDLEAKDIKESIGEDEFCILFPEDEARGEAEEEPRVNEDERGKEEDPYPAIYPQYGFHGQSGMYGQNPIVDMVSYFLAPFAHAMMPQMVQPQSYPQQSRFKRVEGSDLLNDVNNFQHKIMLLEQEKTEAKKKAESLKDRCVELQEKISDAEKRLVTEREDAEGQVEALRLEKEELNDLLAQAVNNASVVEDERRSLEEQIGQLKDDIAKKEAEQAEKAAKYEELMEAKAGMEKSLADLKREEEKERNIANNKISSLEGELSRVRGSLEETKKALAKAEESIKASEEAKKSAESASKDTDKKVADLERQIAAQKERADKGQKRAEESERTVNALKKEKEKLSGDLDALRKEDEKLKEQVNKLKEGDQERNSYYKKLEQENGDLKKLAYEDAKSGVMNLNAFNRDFVAVDKNDVVLGMVSIRGMKVVNMSYGRNAGDNIISNVAKELMNRFKKETVYRIMGDQFVIIASGEPHDSVHGKLFEAQNVLMQDSINIVFGCAVGRNCDDLGQMVSVAESTMNQMKSGVIDGGYQMPVQTPSMQVPMQNAQPVQTAAPVSSYRATEPAAAKLEPTPAAQAGEPEEVNIDEMLAQYMN